MTRLLPLGVVVAAAAFVTTPLTADSFAPYRVIDLGTLPGPLSATMAEDINARGQIVGFNHTWGGYLEDAVAWRKGIITALDSLPDSVVNEAHAINDVGQIVGIGESPYNTLHAVLWDRGRTVDLGTLVGPQGSSWAEDINVRGLIVGESETPAAPMWSVHATLWRDGVSIDLGTLPGGVQSLAYAINDLGQIVGESETASGEFRAVLWDQGRMVDLGTLPGDAQSAASGINNRGQIVGASATADGWGRAVMWENGQITELPTPAGVSGSSAIAINARGQIVGNADRGPVLWDNGAVLDLVPLPGSYYCFARSINAQGQIVGTCSVGFALTHGVLWTR